MIIKPLIRTSLVFISSNFGIRSFATGLYNSLNLLFLKKKKENRNFLLCNTDILFNILMLI